MRLLHVIAEMARGGAERVVLSLAADASARGDVVAVASAGGPRVSELEELGVRHYPVALDQRSAMATLSAVPALTRVIRDFRPTLVHTHNLRATLATRAACVGVRAPPSLITSVQGLAPSEYRVASRLLRLTTRHVVAVAPSVARSLRATGYGLCIHEIINGAALAPADAQRIDAMRDRLGIGDATLVVGLGRLVPQKSWGTLLEAARELAGTEIVVAGDGPLRRELELQAAKADVPVRFVGPVDDVAALLALATCVVSTSTWEGLPLALLEALSLGVPVVATAVDGVKDVLGDAALLVQPGDSAAVAAGVRRVLGNRVLADRLGREGRRLAGEHTVETMVAGYRRVYAIAARDRVR